MTHETEIYLNAINACVEIVFSRTRRIPATHWEPAEGGEIELEEVWVTRVSGVTYDLDRSEIDSGWLETLDSAAWDAVEADLYDELHDTATYHEDHYV